MMQAAEPRLVLASVSASRRKLLSASGLVFDVVPAAIDEGAVKREGLSGQAGAEQTALRLADGKAAKVAQTDPDAVVIGGDQILVCGGVWYDKPPDLPGARDQLRALRGRAHVLATAVACWNGSTRLWHHVATPRLCMRAFSDAFLEAYLRVEADRVTATVGAYRLEGLGMQLFDRIEGDYPTILGLPLLPLLAFLREQQILSV
jgi:septum formation protein